MSFGGRIGKLLSEARTQLWFLPAITAIAAVALARVLINIDHRIGRAEWWFLFQGTSATGRELVSTIASAMITFTGLVFSITVLVLQLASGQFSPRALRTFLGDRVTHIAMATFVGTFVFALSVLLSIRGSAGEIDRFVPTLSVFAAFVLVLVSTGVFIYYIHHIAHSTRAITVISRIGDELRESIEHMYPNVARGPDDECLIVRPTGPCGEVRASRRGVLTRVAVERLFEIAEKHDGLIEVVPEIGDFVVTDAPILRYWPADREALAGAEETLVFERERTPDQDPMFGIRQLVDIAQRALSPGINDPSTAVQALDQIHEALRIISRRAFPHPVRANDAGKRRLILPRPEWSEMVHLALDEIRESGIKLLQIRSRLAALIEDCIAYAPPHRQGPLREQRELLAAASTDPEAQSDQPASHSAASRSRHEATDGERPRVPHVPTT